MKMVSSRAARLASFFTAFFCISVVLATAQSASDAFAAMKWRLIGPFRAGRVTSVAGVPNQTSIYYIGTPDGGIWKTGDAGRTWNPIFDQEHVSSIGAIAVAPSNPSLLYAGTGEESQGNGVYRSTDGGATWANIGLRETHTIAAIVVDPKNPDIIVVAAPGNVTSGENRGIFRTTDGGKNWTKVLYKDVHSGIYDLAAAPDDHKTMYSTMWTRGAAPITSTQPATGRVQDGAIYKSTDAGATWAPISGNGLPTEPHGRIGVAVAPGSRGKTVFAIMTQGLFRSDDGGNTWQRSTTDPRILGSFYFSRVFVDPSNPKAVYVAQTTMYRSLDGGRTFEGFYGAPSGDDIHTMWINPHDSRYMILGVDQGAIVSVNGGQTWSSWYNQPTGQFYHVTTDNKFPYHVYAAQQDSGTAAVASRSDYGEITYRDWAPTGGFEFSFIAPDPLDTNIVYIGGWYGSVLRFDRTTGQIVHVLVRSPKYRTAGMAPIAFSPQDPHSLYVGAQYVLRTRDGGQNWEEASPDLTAIPQAANAKPTRGRGQPVISTMALSTLKEGVIWAGTSNGLVQVTRNGKDWENVTPKGLPERVSVESIEASHQDPASAYATFIVQQELKPYVFRTHDFGQSWEEIIDGLPSDRIARVVRDDSARKGLLYAGVETGAYVSFDDGENWQSLQLNLPNAPIRDLYVHGSDLVAATYGRALWILDDLSPLRQFEPNSATRLLKPETAIRTRWDMNQDTPLPPEEPAGKNPPNGAILDYYLKAGTTGDLKLQIFDSRNNLVREYSSLLPQLDKTPANAPEYWFAPPAVLTTTPGHNRFVWDLRYPPPKKLRYGYYGYILDYIEYTLADYAIPGETPRDQPQGPLVMPGDYTVVLTAGGQAYKQPLKVTLDPRVKVSHSDLVQQLDAERNISAQMAVTFDAYQYLASLRKEIAARELALSAGDAQPIEQLKSLDKQVSDLADGTPAELGIGPINRESARLATMIGSGDAKPADELQTSVNHNCQLLGKRLGQWKDLSSALSAMNNTLEQKKVQPLPTANIPSAPDCMK